MASERGMCGVRKMPSWIVGKTAFCSVFDGQLRRDRPSVIIRTLVFIRLLACTVVKMYLACCCLWAAAGHA